MSNTEKKNPLDNLTPFKKGAEWNGNHKGKPKGSREIAAALGKILKLKSLVKAEDVPILAKDMKLSQLDIICLALIKECRAGNVQAINTLFDRLGGKPALQRFVDPEGEETGGAGFTGQITVTIE